MQVSLKVYDQPPFFLVPEESQDDFAGRLKALADPEFPNAVVVGQQPRMPRNSEFSWTDFN